MDFADEFSMPFGVAPKSATKRSPMLFGTPGAFTWVCPESGIYAFRLWGGGGNGQVSSGTALGGGGAGAYARKTVRCVKGQTVTGTVGTGALGSNTNTLVLSGSDSIVNLPGITVTAGAGGNPVTNIAALGGVATNGDINYSGGAGGISSSAGNPGQGPNPGPVGQGAGNTGGGGSAPGDELLQGGCGGTALSLGGGGGATRANLSTHGGFPGGGAGSVYATTGASGLMEGGNGLVMITHEGP